MQVWIALMMLFVCSVSHADLSDMFKQLEKALGEGVQQVDNKIESQTAVNEIEVGPNGIEAACNSMYNNASNDEFNIKSAEWTQEVIDFLKQKTETCAKQKIAAINPDKYPAEIESEKRNAEGINVFIDKKYEHALSLKEEKRKADESTKNTQGAINCQQSDIYELYKNENAVVNYQQAVDDLKTIQKKEKEITKESGVRNLAVERNLAVRLITYRDLRDAHFKLYKRYRGKASAAEKVKREIKYPCE